ncbi:MAG: helix-turn-helix transcriptional regulator [Dactylosporangium sp.]|nr:helix-turn-helix domain-containing protein [Dactylosporangium sp.]NNJ61184.1 helix-turn-helix transcriptional regulator [Dactylosporangium sp.]
MSDIGARLRQARQAAGVSLSAMAARTHYSKSYLGNVETGRRAATVDVVLAYEHALGGDVDRRTLLTGAAAGAVATTAVSELVRRGFAAALGERSSDDDWFGRVEAYGRDYMSVGAADLQARLAGDLVVLQQHLETPLRWGAAARLMTVYGKTMPATGGRRGAVTWYRMAAIAADRSQDSAVRVWVRGRAALALGYEGAALPVARDLAEQALTLSDLPSLGRLNALMAMAQIAAVDGDRSTALTTLDTARRVFDRCGSDDQISDFAVPEWRMATFTSMLLSRLGDPRAVEAQDTADRTRPASLPRFATHIELHRGLMAAKTGDLAGGVDHARRALALLPVQRHSLSLRLMMEEIERAGA